MKSLTYFIIYFFFVQISKVNLLFSKKKKIKKINYFHIRKDTNNNYLDHRSTYYIKKNNLEKSINFIRCDNILVSFLMIFKIPNVVFFNYIYHFLISFKNNTIVDNERNLVNFFYKYLKDSKINEFHTIDDYRTIRELIAISKKLNLKTFAYMHGRFIKHRLAKYVNKKTTFDNYFVWSRFFKKQLLELNPLYKKKKIFFFKNPNLINFNHKKKLNRDQVNILYIHENIVPDNVILDILKKILKDRNVNLFYKFRANEKISNKIINFCKMNSIQFFHKEKIFDIFSDKKISAIIASNSTTLLECSFYEIFPIMFRYYLNPSEYIKNKVVFILPVNNDISKNIKIILQKKKELLKIKKKLWN